MSFDDLARSLASPMPRRRALRLIAGAVAAGAFGGLRVPFARADAQCDGQPNGTPCNDGNACTVNDVCVNGVCTGTPVSCQPLDQCHTAGTCNPATGQCSNPAAPNGTACNDGNACTQSDFCQDGVCVGANPVTCQPLDQCHTAGTCNPATGQCSNPAAPDGTACTPQAGGSGTCQNGVCVPNPTAVSVQSFSARRAPRGVLLTWRTRSESDLAGFHVYREAGGRSRRLTARPIAARGGVSGRTYSLFDRKAPANAQATYRLQEVRLDGSRVWAGVAQPSSR